MATIALSSCAAPTSTPEPSSTVDAATRTIVVIGDSIPFNSPDDCPGCIGFADSYASALTEEAGEEYLLQNHSRHDSAQAADIRDELASGTLEGALAEADIVLVSVGYNDQPPYWIAGDPCAVDPLDTDDQAIDGVLVTTPERR